MIIDTIRFDKIGKALGDPRRLEIYRLIAKNPGITCGEVVSSADVSQPTVSHHLKELTDCGLVNGIKDGQFTRLSPDLEVLEAYRNFLQELA